jgi:hypothetical protein
VKPISAGEDDSTTPKDQSRASPRIKAYSFAARPQVIQAVGCEYGISEIEMKIRPFQDADAAFCFRVRSSAFIRKFYGELAPREVTAAVNAYLPEDFIRMAKEATLPVVLQYYCKQPGAVMRTSPSRLHHPSFKTLNLDWTRMAVSHPWLGLCRMSPVQEAD